jgi:hypothetical protein
MTDEEKRREAQKAEDARRAREREVEARQFQEERMWDERCDAIREEREERQSFWAWP